MPPKSLVHVKRHFQLFHPFSSKTPSSKNAQSSRTRENVLFIIQPGLEVLTIFHITWHFFCKVLLLQRSLQPSSDSRLCWLPGDPHSNRRADCSFQMSTYLWNARLIIDSGGGWTVDYYLWCCCYYILGAQGWLTKQR